MLFIIDASNPLMEKPMVVCQCIKHCTSEIFTTRDCKVHFRFLSTCFCACAQKQSILIVIWSHAGPMR